MSTEDEIVDVVLNDMVGCDLCTGAHDGAHWAWTCPRCGEFHDHYQVDLELLSPDDRDLACRCGVRFRITEEAVAEWERDPYQPPATGYRRPEP